MEGYIWDMHAMDPPSNHGASDLRNGARCILVFYEQCLCVPLDLCIVACLRTS